MEGDTFKKVSNNDIPTVLNILEGNWAGNFLLHQYISIMSHNMTKKNYIAQVLYCSGDFDNGVYLIETKFKLVKDLSFFFVFTLANEFFSLKSALMETKRIPWQHPESYIFEVTLNRFTPAICDVFMEKRLKFLVQHYILMWLPPHVRVNAKEIPENLCSDYLNETHAVLIDRQWPSFRNQKDVVKSEISSLFGCGIFQKSDRKLLSYALCFHSGGIFMVYTDESMRRKGLGDIVTRSIILKIQQRGWTPFCTVFSDNIPSMNLMKGIGFLEYSKADFIFPFQFINSIS